VKFEALRTSPVRLDDHRRTIAGRVREQLIAAGMAMDELVGIDRHHLGLVVGALWVLR